ncbi:MAG: NodT family efflux transporter, outer membrane factor (OMF) lipoprotein [Burkholderia sp.]|jgi:NodT family efflux transporter outer membrane factor (OMF) lipoprotein
MMSLRLRPAAACLAALSLVLSGCALQMPDTEQMMRDVAPQSWSVPLPGKGDPAAMRDFWKNWNDPVLLRLVLRAEEANTDVLTALATLRAARASLLDANAALWPSASIGANAQKDRAQNVTSDTYSAAGDASWTFNLAGSSLSNRNAAYWNALAKQLSAADTRELIAAETAQAYINYRSAQAQLAVIKDSVANYENTAQLAGWRAAAGTSSQAEAEQALVELGTARARIPEIQTSITEYRNALARLTSLPADRLDLGEGPIPEPPAGLASSIPAETLMRRADVQGAVAAVRSAAESLRKSQEDYFPTLTLTGSIGTQAAAVGALGASGTGIASLIGALSMPVLNWGSLKAAEESAAAGLDEAKASYVSVLVKALEETDNALQGISSSEARDGVLREAILHAQESYRLSELEYRSGVGDYTLLLSAQLSLLTVRESLVTNQANRANQYVMLYRSIGGAWASAGDEGQKQ